MGEALFGMVRSFQVYSLLALVWAAPMTIILFVLATIVYGYVTGWKTNDRRPSITYIK